MRQVWKFEISQDESPTRMQVGAEILSIGFQGDRLYLWALVDIEADCEDREIIIRGTGRNIRLKDIEFIGTAFLGELVFHVFEVTHSD